MGRNHRRGDLAAGFYCGDMMVMTPDQGSCCAEYHVASDLYPTERKLVPVRDSRRVAMHNDFFSISFGQGLLGNGARLYTPNSSYIDLETRELKQETVLRHLVAYIHSVLENLSAMKDFSRGMERNLGEIEETLRNGTFVVPGDEKEVIFYRALIVKLLKAGRDVLASIPRGGMFFHSSAYRPEDYDRHWTAIERLVENYKGVILGG